MPVEAAESELRQRGFQVSVRYPLKSWDEAVNTPSDRIDYGSLSASKGQAGAAGGGEQIAITISPTPSGGRVTMVDYYLSNEHMTERERLALAERKYPIAGTITEQTGLMSDSRDQRAQDAANRKCAPFPVNRHPTLTIDRAIDLRLHLVEGAETSIPRNESLRLARLKAHGGGAPSF